MQSEIERMAGVSENEFVAIVNRIMDRIVSTWVFGYFDSDDIRQEAFIIATKAIRSGKYDKCRKLEPFLFRSISNGLFNLKRGVTGKFASPCQRCPLFDRKYESTTNQCKAFTNKLDCDKYMQWELRNAKRNSLINPISFSSPDEDEEDVFDIQTYTIEHVLDEAIKNEITDLINNNLPATLRGNFLKMMAGIKIKTQDRKAVQSAIYDIIKTSGIFSDLIEDLDYEQCT